MQLSAPLEISQRSRKLRRSTDEQLTTSLCRHWTAQIYAVYTKWHKKLTNWPVSQKGGIFDAKLIHFLQRSKENEQGLMKIG